MSTVPSNVDKHLMCALVLGRHAGHDYLVIDAERRDRAAYATTHWERERQSLLKIVEPAHRLLFGPVSVNDDLVEDAPFARRVLRWPRASVSHLGSRELAANSDRHGAETAHR